MALAIFSTWTTFGTWLPGDERGWFHHGRWEAPDVLRRFEATLQMSEDAAILSDHRRRLVERTIADHCIHRRWTLYAVNCRSNHVHVVVSAPDQPVNLPREQFKSWCTRKLIDEAKASGLATRRNWWTQRGWDSLIYDENGLAEAVDYVLNRQSPRDY
jgi:REP element-mobilizing transposase RayT